MHARNAIPPTSNGESLLVTRGSWILHALAIGDRRWSEMYVPVENCETELRNRSRPDWLSVRQWSYSQQFRNEAPRAWLRDIGLSHASGIYEDYGRLAWHAKIALLTPVDRYHLDPRSIRRGIGGIPQRLHNRSIEDVSFIKGLLRLHDEEHLTLREEELKCG